MVSTIEFDRLADTLEDIRAQVRALSTTPALAFSSIEAGAILEHDADGNVVGQIGEQWDGTHAAISLGGPNPPTPSSAGAVDAGAGSVNIYYDGTFVNADGIPDITIPVPSDYARTEIHASQDPEFTAEHWSTLTDSYDSPRGGMKTIALTSGTWYIRLVTRTLSGKRSLPASAPTPVVVAAALTDQDLADMEARFDTDMAALDAALVTLGDETSGLDDRLLLAETDLDTAFGQIDAAQQLAGTAEANAQTALTNAAGAASAAAAADQLARDAAGLAGTKGETIVQISAPTGTRAVAQNLWIRLPDNIPHRWNPDSANVSKWEPVTDKTATDAAAAAAGALSAANNVSKNLFSTSTPSGTAPYGSTWFQVNGTGQVIGQWQQTAAGIASTWTSRPVRSEVIANLDLGKLTVGAAAMASAVVDKLAVETAAVMNLDVGRLVAATANITTGVADKFFANIFATRRLSAQQIYVGPGANPIPDPAFLDATTTAARIARSTALASSWTEVPGTATSPKGLRRTTPSGGALLDLWPLPTATAADIPGMIAVEAGDTWKLSVDVETSTTTGVYWGLRIAKADGTISAVQVTPSNAVAVGRRTITASYKVPAGVIAMTPYVNTGASGTIFTVYGNPFMGLKTDATLTVEGLINGQTVLGARIATADTGARIELNGLDPANPKFLGVNTSGQTYMDFSATGAFLKAVLEVDAPLFGQRIVLGPMTIPTSPTTSFEAAGLAFYKAVEPVGETPPMITSYDGDTLVLEGRKSTSSLPGKLYVGQNLTIQAEGDLDLQGNFVATGNVDGYDVNASRQFNGANAVIGRSLLGFDGLITGGTGNGNGQYVIFARSFPGFYIRNDGTLGAERSNDAAIWAPGLANNILIRAPFYGTRGAVRIDSGSFFEYYDPPTSTFTANLGIASNPKDRVYKLGSSAELKVNREPITDEHAWRILDLAPRKWYDRTQLEELLGPDVIDSTDRLHPKIDPALLAGLDIRMHPGLVAQEVHAAGLTEFVDYEGGEPSAVDYDRMWTLILPILRYILERVGYPSTAKVPIKPSPMKRPPVTKPGARK